VGVKEWLPRSSVNTSTRDIQNSVGWQSGEERETDRQGERQENEGQEAPKRVEMGLAKQEIDGTRRTVYLEQAGYGSCIQL